MNKSWVNVSENSDFPIENLPYGIFKTNYNHSPRAGIAIGEFILDLSIVSDLGFFNDIDFDEGVFSKKYLNEFIAFGKEVHKKVRLHLINLLSENDKQLSIHAKDVLIRQSDAEMLMPIKIGDYTDFYSSEEHATNVGKMFRPDNPLMPNWKHLPVAYHGRSSSIVISGTPLHRPKGQARLNENEPPIFGACKNLDYELEMAFVVGKQTKLGESVSVKNAEDYIFGFVIFNDWSARDIQKWEYQPLGPFLSKNFGSSISPWIVTLDALEPFRTNSPVPSIPLLHYLQSEGERTFDIKFNVSIQPENGEREIIAQSNFKNLYWNISQQLAHHTVNGCNINVGDLMASGTISGGDPSSVGSMLELTEGGRKPITLKNGMERKFIDDNDTVTMNAFCEKEGLRIGFGEVKTKILPTL